MSGLYSRNKGKRLERDLAKHLATLGFDGCRRGAQHRGGPDSPDVLGLPGVHIECKGGYDDVDLGSKRLIEWRQQAVDECPIDKRPILYWKPDRKPWRLDFALAGWKYVELWGTVCGAEAERAVLKKIVAVLSTTAPAMADGKSKENEHA